MVTGSQAVYQGSGSVDGKSGYGFRVTATDSPDTFHLRIWKKSGGEVVYDNLTGSKVTGIITMRQRPPVSSAPPSPVDNHPVDGARLCAGSGT